MEQWKILQITFLLGSLVSLVSASYVVTLVFKSDCLPKGKIAKILCWISICDIVRSLGQCIGSFPTGDPLCKTQATLMILGGTAAFAWVGLLSFHMILLVHYNNKGATLSKKTCAVAFIAPIIFATLPNLSYIVTIDVYQNLGGLCFFGLDRTSELWSFVFFYLWMWLALILAFIACLVVGSYIKSKNRRMSDANIGGVQFHEGSSVISVDFSYKRIPSAPLLSKEDEEAAMKSLKALVWYPLMLLICWFCPTVRRIFIFWSVDVPFGLVFSTLFTASLYGFCNSIAFTLVTRPYFVNRNPL